MTLRGLSVALGLLAAGPLLAQETAAPTSATTSATTSAPMSAIDWLSQSVETPAPAAMPLTGALRIEPPVSGTGASPSVTVTPLDRDNPDAVGLLPPEVTGLPASLWSASDEATLTALMTAERVETLPALQDLLRTLTLAEADPPLDSTPEGRLFRARVDKLLDLGAIDPAQSLIEAAGPDTPELFRRWFDIALLSGTEDSACAVLRAKPDVAPTYAARIFCLARGGDWQAAALILNTGRALGDISDEDDRLLSRFLDPDLYEGEPPLPPPTRVSPLIFRLREAIGEGLPTATLPRAFANADLRDTTGWKGQLEAAERLARNGAISENVLQALYTARTPAASGGVWDRVRAFQALDTAVTHDDPGAVAAALPEAWAGMQAIRCEVPFARLYAQSLRALPLTGDAASLAFRISLLSPDYETAAQAWTPKTGQETLWRAIATGNVSALAPRTDPIEAAVVAAFAGAAPPAELAAEVRQGKLGEAILRALALFDDGLTGDPAEITDALALFRQVGLEDQARQAALQALILDRRP